MNLAQQSVLASTSGLIFVLINLQQALESNFTSGCVCPRDTLTYECTAMGEGATVWTETAFNCLSSNYVILLLHSHFSSTEGDYGSCNNGTIVGQSLGVEGNNYTSQLNVTVTPDTAGISIECLYDNGLITTLVFALVIPTTGPLSSPNGLKFNNANYSSRIVTFLWSPVAPDCPAIHYNIIASDCGSCPTTTDHTTVMCTDIPTNDSTCSFAVQTVVCGNITGNISYPISFDFYATEPTLQTSLSVLSPTVNLGTRNLNTTETVGTYHLDTNTAVNTISFSSLAAALIISIAIFIAVTAIILRRSKACKNTPVFIQSNRAEGTTSDEPMYDTITDPLPSVGTITTQGNVAYGHTKTSTTAV